MARRPAQGVGGPVSGRLILVRHGETVANVARRLDTRVPGAPLTELGNRQAREAGERLATPPIALISSVALRARQTAAHIETVTGVSTEAVDGIFEVQVGDLQDRSDKNSHETFKQIYHRWHEGDLRARVPGGESGADVLDRFLPVIADLRGKYLDSESDKSRHRIQESGRGTGRLARRRYPACGGSVVADAGRIRGQQPSRQRRGRRADRREGRSLDLCAVGPVHAPVLTRYQPGTRQPDRLKRRMPSMSVRTA